MCQLTLPIPAAAADRKSTRLNSSHLGISYAVFCLNDPATPEIYTLSLHDALPISIHRASTLNGNRHHIKFERQAWVRMPQLVLDHAGRGAYVLQPCAVRTPQHVPTYVADPRCRSRSEEHTSELQSLRHLVCRLLLE